MVFHNSYTITFTVYQSTAARFKVTRSCEIVFMIYPSLPLPSPSYAVNLRRRLCRCWCPGLPLETMRRGLIMMADFGSTVRKTVLTFTRFPALHLIGTGDVIAACWIPSTRWLFVQARDHGESARSVFYILFSYYINLCKKLFSLEKHCKGDIVVGDIKQQRSIFHHYKISNFTVTHCQ